MSAAPFLQATSNLSAVLNSGLPAPPRRDVRAVFHYLNRSISQETLNLGANIATANGYGALDEAIICTVNDVTGRENSFTFNKHGFEYHIRPTKLNICDWEHQDLVETVYYSEIAEIIKQLTGASYVHVFNHLTRVSQGSEAQPRPVKVQGRQQVYKAHVDQVPSQIEEHVRYRFPAEEAERLLRSHFQVINVWRPIETIYKDPLAVVGLNSVSAEDFVDLQISLPEGRRGSNVAVRWNPDHCWYYKYAQTPDEVVLFKQYDSREEAVCFGQVPHSAFVDEAEQDNYARRSVEVRAFVFYENNSK
ncbi:hypothetical protein BKA64DRAFT_147162 [Cadophora sp. MPI-SDFR-AT-0126]|nr:hypothetical protein BKA64DRAFT_147162 [Leotiomycetes sp. MPI-SDFR-AT-0126]